MSARVAINGLGRIGRATLKILHESPSLEIVGINDLTPPDNLAYLLNYDSVYGRYDKSVEAIDAGLRIDGMDYRVFDNKDPAELPWRDLEVDIVFECTGIFRTAQAMQKHLDAGAGMVILSAPAKSDDVPTVVHGVNSTPDNAKMISCASCTTNCITPVFEVMSRRIGVKKAIMSTVHAYTSSQAIVDASSGKWRRGRAGAANIVPTSTGAAQATTKVLPDFDGRFDGMAMRVPVAVGSIADITFLTDRATTVEEVNEIFAKEASSERYGDILGATADPLVSSDIVMDPRASVVNLDCTQVVDGDLVKVMSWYDNEWGYSSQMVREAARITGGKA